MLPTHQPTEGMPAVLLTSSQARGSTRPTPPPGGPSFPGTQAVLRLQRGRPPAQVACPAAHERSRVGHPGPCPRDKGLALKPESPCKSQAALTPRDHVAVFLVVPLLWPLPRPSPLRPYRRSSKCTGARCCLEENIQLLYLRILQSPSAETVPSLSPLPSEGPLPGQTESQQTSCIEVLQTTETEASPSVRHSRIGFYDQEGKEGQPDTLHSPSP